MSSVILIVMIIFAVYSRIFVWRHDKKKSSLKEDNVDGIEEKVYTIHKVPTYTKVLNDEASF